MMRRPPEPPLVLHPPLPGTGSGRIMMNGLIRNAVWSTRTQIAYEQEIVFEDGRSAIVSDREERLGFVYRAPDSGSTMTNIMVLLDDDEPDPVGIPDANEMRTASIAAVMPLYGRVAAGEIDSDDLDFCRQLFSSPEAMTRTIQRTGSLEAAYAHVLREIFGIHV